MEGVDRGQGRGLETSEGLRVEQVVSVAEQVPCLDQPPDGGIDRPGEHAHAGDQLFARHARGAGPMDLERDPFGWVCLRDPAQR